MKGKVPCAYGRVNKERLERSAHETVLYRRKKAKSEVYWKLLSGDSKQSRKYQERAVVREKIAGRSFPLVYWEGKKRRI